MPKNGAHDIIPNLLAVEMDTAIRTEKDVLFAEGEDGELCRELRGEIELLAGENHRMGNSQEI